MAEQVLNVTGLAARVEDKQLLHGVDLTINKGETHVLMGPNGAGKSTLGYVLMGAPKYTVARSCSRARISPMNPPISAPRLACSFLSRSRWKFPA